MRTFLDGLSVAARARLLPDAPGSWTSRAALESAAGRPLEALDALDRASRLDPGALEPYAEAVGLMRAHNAWRTLPAFADRALAALPVATEWRAAVRGALVRGAPREAAGALAIGLAEIAVARGDDLEAGRTMLLSDPRRPKAILDMDLLAIRLDPGWSRPYARARRLAEQLGLREVLRSLAHPHR